MMIVVIDCNDISSHNGRICEQTVRSILFVLLSPHCASVLCPAVYPKYFCAERGMYGNTVTLAATSQSYIEMPMWYEQSLESDNGVHS